jgi:glutamate racemase
MAAAHHIPDVQFNASAPVGVFDSGIGGLSVLRDIRRALPCEDLLYIADSGHVPYGNKSPSFIRERSRLLTEFLLGKRAKAVVIACNTATAAAAGFLRSRYATPIVAMEPAVKPAMAATRSGIIGVLATVGTLSSARFAALLERFGNGVQVVVQPCPGLVECVEAGDLDGKATRELVEKYTTPLCAAGADVIVLGCTHYPFLRPLIACVVGPQVTLIDTGSAVARQLHRVLEANNLLSSKRSAGTERFWTTGDLDSSRRVVACLWDSPVEVEKILPQSLMRLWRTR